jgi:N-acetylglucosamine-6-phosphate deacetylase
MLGTTMTATDNSIRRALRGLAPSIAERPAGAARMLGVHLEGPFLSIHRLGAQPADAIAVGSMDLVRSYHAMAPIRAMTLATEVAGHLQLIPQLNAGHPRADRPQQRHYEDGVAALQAGAAGFTHLFNGMTALNHYKPGIVGAALAHAEYAEIIPTCSTCSRRHPRCAARDPAPVRRDRRHRRHRHARWRIRPGQPARLQVHGLRAAGHRIAGRQRADHGPGAAQFRRLGLDLADASHRLSLYPADYLGETERGRLRRAPGPTWWCSTPNCSRWPSSSKVKPSLNAA